MIKKDFILRFIEEIAKAIGKILHLLKDGDLKEAQKMYDYSFSLLENVNEEKLLHNDVCDFYKQLEKDNGDVEALMQNVVFLLFVGAKINKQKGDIVLYTKKRNKALEILEYIDNNSNTFSLERNALIAEIKSSDEEDS